MTFNFWEFVIILLKSSQLTFGEISAPVDDIVTLKQSNPRKNILKSICFQLFTCSCYRIIIKNVVNVFKFDILNTFRISYLTNLSRFYCRYFDLIFFCISSVFWYFFLLFFNVLMIQHQENHLLIRSQLKKQWKAEYWVDIFSSPPSTQKTTKTNFLNRSIGVKIPKMSTRICVAWWRIYQCG